MRRREETAPIDPPREPSEAAEAPFDGDVSAYFEPRALGFSRDGGKLDFALHAQAERGVEVELFEPAAAEPFRRVGLDPDPTAPAPWQLWTASFDDLPAAFDYVVRVDGGPALIDPYARELDGGGEWGRSDDAIAPGVGRRYRSRFVEVDFDWEGVERPRIEPTQRVVAELHVRGFTRHPSSGVARPGTYLGLIEKIPELVDLGVTTVELMPLFEFDETENPRTNPKSGERLLNLWGYSPVSFFAPKAAYATGKEPGAPSRELRELVRELHRAGLEVVLDVVYNHTGEGRLREGDPLHGWLGLDPAAYYLLAPDGAPIDVTGCGNTVRLAHPVAHRLVLDSLRHWSRELRIDGFRFDLAAVLFRGAAGEELARSPLAEAIAADPELSQRLLIAEPWDARGFRPTFPEPWLTWDDDFRDATRRLVGGFDRDPRPLARRLSGRGAPPPRRSVQFVACHDGRPLADVMTWAQKHNLPNGEQNHDGWDREVAWNNGVEGPTATQPVASMRARQLRLLWTLLAAAPGTLMFAAGDERLRTQGGNTNAWCQDNETGWLDWSVDAEGEQLRNFVRRLLAFRRQMLVAPRFSQISYSEPYSASGAVADAERSAFLLVHGNADGEAVWMLALNPGDAPVRFPLPSARQGLRWQLRLDTVRPPGEEIFLEREAPFLAFETTHLAVAARAARVLVAESLEG